MDRRGGGIVPRGIERSIARRCVGAGREVVPRTTPRVQAAPLSTTEIAPATHAGILLLCFSTSGPSWAVAEGCPTSPQDGTPRTSSLSKKQWDVPWCVSPPPPPPPSSFPPPSLPPSVSGGIPAVVHRVRPLPCHAISSPLSWPPGRPSPPTPAARPTAWPREKNENVPCTSPRRVASTGTCSTVRREDTTSIPAVPSTPLPHPSDVPTPPAMVVFPPHRGDPWWWWGGGGGKEGEEGGTLPPRVVHAHNTHEATPVAPHEKDAHPPAYFAIHRVTWWTPRRKTRKKKKRTTKRGPTEKILGNVLPRTS